MSVLRILDATGDTTLEWGTKTATLTTKEVEKKFNRIMSKGGFQAFRIDSPTEGELIRQFDPNAEEIIITRPLMGG